MIRLRIDAIRPDASVIETAAAVIRGGALVAFPTDTLYGLAADPFNSHAVRRIFAVKGRGADRAVPLVAASTEQLIRHLGELSPAARRLAGRFWPGPLTILLPAPPLIAVEATGGTGKIGVRVPDHRVAVDLCRACDRPLTATSANISGQPPSDDPDVVAASFSKTDVDILLDAGRTSGGAPSTVVDVSGAEPLLVRAGALSWEEILACLKS